MGFLDRFRSHDEPERSPGGSYIERHGQAAEPSLSGGDGELIEAVVAHIEAHVGDPAWVFHQLVSPYVHVDIHVVAPTEERPWTTLVTSGMSERPMNFPPELQDAARAELVMALPPNWPTERERMREESIYWPFRLLQTLATLPHQYDTWLWLGHTVPNGDPPEPYAPDTGLCCALIGPAMLAGEGFQRLEHRGRTVTFFGVYPLYADEVDFKLERGGDELDERLEAADVTELLQPERPSVA